MSDEEYTPGAEAAGDMLMGLFFAPFVIGILAFVVTGLHVVTETIMKLTGAVVESVAAGVSSNPDIWAGIAVAILLAVYAIVYAWRVHLHHSSNEEDSDDHVCSNCGESFENSTKLDIHEKHEDCSPGFECSVCGKSFDSERGLHIHQAQKDHGGDE